MSDGVGAAGILLAAAGILLAAAGILLAAAGRQGLDTSDLAAKVSGYGEAAGIC
jgi:hypothetical protein